eukprot:TRINITY_DN15338_c0_g1_i2.p1 TRINITY_DN15338_c0_g1~~TRINITY_DN15338_c0_g1_i2.p1  ORF type:complete len:252 (+),score=40.67 TRINITY_DN15338_c0_g1_i2:155-910(+)
MSAIILNDKAFKKLLGRHKEFDYKADSKSSTNSRKNSTDNSERYKLMNKYTQVGLRHKWLLRKYKPTVSCLQKSNVSTERVVRECKQQPQNIDSELARVKVNSQRMHSLMWRLNKQQSIPGTEFSSLAPVKEYNVAPRYSRRLKNSGIFHYHRKHKSIQSSESSANESANSVKASRLMRQCDAMREKYSRAIHKVMKLKSTVKKCVSIIQSNLESSVVNSEMKEIIEKNKSRKCFIYGKSGKGRFLSSCVL